MSAPSPQSPFASFLWRRKKRKLDAARLKLADLQHDLGKWGFSFTPSEKHHAKARIERQRARVDRLERELAGV